MLLLTGVSFAKPSQSVGCGKGLLICSVVFDGVSTYSIYFKHYIPSIHTGFHQSSLKE